MSYLSKIKKVIAAYDDWILYFGNEQKKFEDLNSLLEYAGKNLDPISMIEVDDEHRAIHITLYPILDAAGDPT